MSHPYFFISKENNIYASKHSPLALAGSDDLQCAESEQKNRTGVFSGTGNKIGTETIELNGRDFYHLVKVLRAKKGDIVELSDNCAFRYQAEVCSVQKDSAILSVKRATPIIATTPSISLYLCILKKDAMELAIQKTAEIGIGTIVPVLSSRTVVKLDKHEFEPKAARWQQIASEASKQCKRDFECIIKTPVPLIDADISGYDIFFAALEPETFKIKALKNSSVTDFQSKLPEAKDIAGTIDGGPLCRMQKIAYIIGPEGGFDQNEVSLLAKKGAVAVTFGKNILRSETAAIYFLSVLDYLIKTGRKII
jgi:16S rRNA (uracil1498-N3)-methyltransferase